MNKTYIDLMNLLSNRLFNKEVDVEINDEILKEASKQAVLSLIKNDDLLLASNMKVTYGHSEIHKLLTSNNISYTVLKGLASSHYYKKPELRTLGDVDFLVNKQDVDKVKKILIDNGFIDENAPCDHHMGFKHNGITYELHFCINGIPDGKSGEIVNKELTNIIEDSKLTKISFVEVNIPSDYHNGIIFILHIIKHFVSSGIGLRHLCDWAMFVDSFEDFPSVFEETFRQIGVWEFTKQLTALCIKYLGLSKKDWVPEYDEAFLNEFIEDVLGNGNFGKKNTNAYTGAFTSDNGGNIIIAGIKTANKVAYNYFPFMKKFKILLPLFWIYFIIRYIFRVLTGKRKMFTSKSLKQADYRSKIISKFKLFE